MSGRSAGYVHPRSQETVTIMCPSAQAGPHLDFGYAVTSHRSQGQTADRVLVHIDTDRAGAPLINRRLAYVAISRGRHDAQIYTNDSAQLAPALGRGVSHRSALEPTRTPGAPGVSVDAAVSRHPVAEQTQGFDR